MESLNKTILYTLVILNLIVLIGVTFFILKEIRLIHSEEIAFINWFKSMAYGEETNN